LQCENANGAWIFPLVVVDAIVIALAIYFMRPPPEMFYPILFYVQTVPYLVKGRLHPLLEPMFYISNALALYFPWDACLFPGATALDMYALRFTPVIVFLPVSIVMMAILIRTSLWKSIKNGLWFLFLLICNHTMNTIIALLNCPSLYNNTGQQKSVSFS
jgi:hypothetical protein